jgi:hypothetical protein
MRIDYKILFLAILFSCENNKTIPLSEKVENLVLGFDRVIVIPIMGCIGCLEEANEFVFNALDYNNTLFILSNISDKKSTRISFSEAIKYENVYLDELNEVGKELGLGIFPLVFSFHDGKLNLLDEAKSGISKHLR